MTDNSQTTVRNGEAAHAGGNESEVGVIQGCSDHDKNIILRLVI